MIVDILNISQATSYFSSLHLTDLSDMSRQTRTVYRSYLKNRPTMKLSNILFKHVNKVECAFPMVISSEFRSIGTATIRKVHPSLISFNPGLFNFNLLFLVDGTQSIFWQYFALFWCYWSIYIYWWNEKVQSLNFSLNQLINR